VAPSTVANAQPTDAPNESLLVKAKPGPVLKSKNKSVEEAETPPKPKERGKLLRGVKVSEDNPTVTVRDQPVTSIRFSEPIFPSVVIEPVIRPDPWPWS